MRDAACKSWMNLSDNKDFIFFTGDLGFKALEPLREVSGAKFVNCGVAEQNMVSVAAGTAREGFRPWVYSIAPFCYARPFEQIRNDICMHALPVQLVGNGGGYGYGVMGATHHALEDYGVLSTLNNLVSYIPTFDEDVWPIVEKMAKSSNAGYLRLGLSEKPAGQVAPPYAPWRKIMSGRGPLLIGVGPLIGDVWKALLELPEGQRPELWVVAELPITSSPPPPDFVDSVSTPRNIIVFEEHVENGGFGQMFAKFILEKQIQISSFKHFFARGYLSGLYGSQKFHRRECGLDAASIMNFVESQK